MKIDYSDEITKKMTKEKQELFCLIADYAFSFGVKIYLVGGIVRDLLLDRANDDIDILVEGDAVEFCKYITINLPQTKFVKINSKLRTAELIFYGQYTIDFASTRTELYKRKGYLPEVENIGVDITEDAKRRDFAINTLLISLNKNDRFWLIDLTDARTDLENKKLRVLHNESFIDDPTRILRCLKFSVRLGFEPDSYTKKLINNYLENYNYDISFPRLKTEFISTFNLNLPIIPKLFIENKLYRLLSEKVSVNVDFEELAKNIKKYLCDSSHIWLIYYEVLFFGQKIESFPFTKEEQKIIDCASRVRELLQKEKNIKKLYSAFKKISAESLIICSAFENEHDIFHNYFTNYKNIKTEINGNDLIKMGLKPSKQFDKILNAIINEKMSGNLQTKSDEINYVIENFVQHN